MRVIVSSRFAVEVVDIMTGCTELIRTSDYDTLYYGITWVGKTMFLAKRHLSANRTTLEILDGDLDYVDSIECPEVNDAHQILYHDDIIWVTSCATNSIVKLNSEGEYVGQWYPNPKHKGTDINHFNSLWFGDSIVYVVAHNKGASELFSFTYPDLNLVSIIALGKGTHNVYARNGEAIVLSSGDGYALSDKSKVYNLFRNTYPRGIAVGSHDFVLGLSEHSTDRKDRYRERRGAVQYYTGSIGIHQHIGTYELWHGMVMEVRGLDFPDKAHNGSVWEGKWGI